MENPESFFKNKDKKEIEALQNIINEAVEKNSFEIKKRIQYEMKNLVFQLEEMDEYIHPFALKNPQDIHEIDFIKTRDDLEKTLTELLQHFNEYITEHPLIKDLLITLENSSNIFTKYLKKIEPSKEISTIQGEVWDEVKNDLKGSIETLANAVENDTEIEEYKNLPDEFHLTPPLN